MAGYIRDTSLYESKMAPNSQGKMIISGLFQKCDTQNANKRVYKTSLWESILSLNEIKQQLADRSMLGELGHPDIVETTLINTSHIVTKLELKPNGEVYGEAEVLDTPSGKVLRVLYEAGVRLGISSRGYIPEGSNLVPEGDSLIVPSDYQLVGFDFVLVPSTPGAFPTIKEEYQIKIRNALNESKNVFDQTTYNRIYSLGESVPVQTQVAPNRIVVNFGTINEVQLESLRKFISEKFKDTEIEIKPEYSSLEIKTEMNEGLFRIFAAKLNRCILNSLPELKDNYRINTFIGENKEVIPGSLFKSINSKNKEVQEEMYDKEYVDKLETTIDDVKARYLKAESIIADMRERLVLSEDVMKVLVKQNKSSIHVIEDIRNRYLTAESVIGQFKDYTLSMESALKDMTSMYKISEGVISDLVNRYTLSEDVINDLRGRYLAAEGVIKKLSDRYTLSEEVINQLREEFSVAEGVISDLRDRFILSEKASKSSKAKSTKTTEKVVPEAAKSTKKSAKGTTEPTKKHPKTVKEDTTPVSIDTYFSECADKYNISVSEIKRLYEKVGSTEKGLNFILEEKFSGNKKYEEFPVGKVKIEEKQEDESYLDNKLAHILSRSFQ